LYGILLTTQHNTTQHNTIGKLFMKGKNISIDGKRYYTVSDVCVELGIFKNTLLNWEKKGKIPEATRDLMSKWRIYSREDIDRIKEITGRR